MKIELKSKEELTEIIKSNKTVLVDFYAEWCGACKMLLPVIEEFSGEVDFPIVKVDVDKFQELAMQNEVTSIPTLIVFKDGKETNRTTGFLPKPRLFEITK